MGGLYAPSVLTADAAARPGPTALDGDGSKRAANCPCGLVSENRLLPPLRRDHSERSLLGARAVTMSARMRRALAIALIIVLLVCPQRADGARNPEPTHPPRQSKTLSPVLNASHVAAPNA